MATYVPDVTKATWTQVANKQSYDEMDMSKLNSNTIISIYDPLYNKLIQTIGETIYRKFSVAQNWQSLGITMPAKKYPEQIREIAMLQRKGRNFPPDNAAPITDYYAIPLTPEQIETRYHSAQFRYMDGYDLVDEELRRFSNGTVRTIAELTAMKQINVNSARNMYMDQLRKKLLALFIDNIATAYPTGIDISDYDTLTQEDAQRWLVKIDRLLYQIQIGTAKYNALSQYVQTPKANLQMVIPRDWYHNVMRRAYPNTYHTEEFRGILPGNILLIDTLGDDNLTDGTGAIVPYTSNSLGMSTVTWDTTSKTSLHDPNVQALIFDRNSICVEDNLNEVAMGTRHPEMLTTGVRVHFWTGAYMTDLLTSVKLTIT